MTDVKKVDKTAESGGFHNVGVGKEGAAPEAPKTFTQAQAEYEAKDAAEEAARAKSASGPPTEGEPKPSKATLAEQKAGKEASE